VVDGFIVYILLYYIFTYYGHNIIIIIHDDEDEDDDDNDIYHTKQRNIYDVKLYVDLFIVLYYV